MQLFFPRRRSVLFALYLVSTGIALYPASTHIAEKTEGNSGIGGEWLDHASNLSFAFGAGHIYSPFNCCF
jgi:hypothetical protein